MNDDNTRITVTVKVHTWWGHDDERTIEVEPGIAWQDRALTDVKPIMDDMDELVNTAYGNWMLTRINNHA